MKKISRRELLKGVGTVTVGALLEACTVSAPQAVEKPVVPATVDWLHAEDISSMPSTAIRYWYYESPERTELGQKQVEEFQKMFPNIKVLGRQAPRWTDNQALLAYIKAGTNSHVHQSVYNEDLWYIDHNIPTSPEELPGFKDVNASLNPKLNYKWDGKIWSLPWYFAGQALAYNTKLVKAAGLDPSKPPTIYSEFMEWAKALTIPGKQWFAAPPTGEEWWWWEFLLNPFYTAATGSGDLLDEEGKKPIFNNETYAKVLDLFATLFQKDYATFETFETNPFLSGQVACALPIFLENHLGFLRDGPKDFEYFIGPIPKPDDSTVPGNKTFLFVRNFMLMKEIQKQGEEADRMMRAAWEFEKYLLSPAQAIADFEVSCSPPSQADYQTNVIYQNIANSFGPAFVAHANYVLEQGVFGDMTNLRTVEYQDFQQKLYLNVIRGKMTPAEGLKWAEEQTIELLASL